MRKRMKKVRGLWAGLLAAAVVLTSAAPTALTVQAEEAGTAQAAEASAVEYQIYPTPHEMTYQDGEFAIKDVNIVYEANIDDVTKNRMTEVLSIKGKDEGATVTDAVAEGKTNILAGIYNSKGYVDTYVQENYEVDETLFTHHGSYFLASKDNEIVILGLDTDAVFYGITSLKHIFNQMEADTIRNFQMEDYADVNIRGFIEGYYGIPWSNEDRMSLMEFGGDFKMTSYIFAPKDDPYHAAKWRDLYPEEELAKVKEMVDVGNQSKCRFVWTAHPFRNGFDVNNVQGEIDSLLRKFDQLYEAGVRQFGVLGDDAGGLNRAAVIDVMTQVSEWANKKEGVYDTVFCPGGYNHSWQNGGTGSGYAELNEYDAGFPDDIQIFWTGEAVCEPIEQVTLDHFRTYKATNGERRAPLFWLNWPVNDINHGRLCMGKGVQLHTDINVEDLAGAVTNPMQESELSKPAIFAVADYSWNVKGFDMDKSWADSFAYIDPDASEELHTLAKHMSNPEPNGHGLVLPESEEISGLINTFKTQLATGTVDEATAAQIAAEMETIMNACDGFHAKSKNEAMKAEILPFTNSMKDLCAAIRSFANAQVAMQKEDMKNAFDSYMEGAGSYATSKTYTKEMFNAGPQVVSPGSTHLIPLARALEETLSGPMYDYVAGDVEKPLTITAEASFKTWQSGNPSMIIDGNKDTYAWYNGAEAAGQYYQVNFSEPTTIYGVHIENGAGSDKPDDTFKFAKLKYQVEGSDEWKEVEAGKEYGPYASKVDVAGIEIENVVSVRYECSRTDGNKWPSMREFKVDLQPGTEETFTKEVIRTTEGWKLYSGTDKDMIDGDLSTSVHYNVRQGDTEHGDSMIAGDYVGVKLSEKITLGKIKVVQGNNDTHADYMKNCDLEWSADGETWTKIETFKDKRTIEIDVSDQDIQAQYVRIKNNAEQQNWLAIREFDVDAKVWFNSKVYTNADAYADHRANLLEESAEIEAKDDITLKKDEYIGLKLDRIHEIKNIEKTLEKADALTLEISLNGYEWTTYDESKPGDARYIRLLNKTDKDVKFNIDKFVVNTVEFKEKTLHSQSGNYPIVDAEKAFDGDRTTEAVYQTSQNAGVWFVYDLGRTIHFDTFKAVCQDGEHDFIRHGKFSVSTDGETWEEIMTLGSQDGPNAGEAEDTDEIGSVLPNHETSYNTKEATGINKDARYLKFEVTRTKVGSDKWVRFSELEINGGAYMPTENDPTYESTSSDTQNGKYSYMSDMSLATSFIPAEESGTLTYHVSDKNDRNKIKIVQRADSISNATVSVRTLDKADEWQTVGTLAETVNEFVLPKDKVLLDVKIEWKDTKVGIIEMFLTKGDAETPEPEPEVNKADLEKLYNEYKDIEADGYTEESYKAFSDALANAKDVLDNAEATQDEVNAAATDLEAAYKGLVKEEKPVEVNKDTLQKLYNEYKDIKADGYTEESYKAFSDALANAKDVLDNAEATQDEVNAAATDLEAAYKGLVKEEKPVEVNKDTLQKLYNEYKDIKADGYTEESYKAFSDALAKAKDVLDNTEATQDEVNAAATDLEEAKQGLVKEEKPVEVNKDALRNRYNEYKDIKADGYTEESFEVFSKALAKAKSVLDDADATQAEVNAAEASLKAAYDGLDEAGTIPDPEPEDVNKNALKAVYNKYKDVKAGGYTAESFEVFSKALAKAKSVLDDADATQAEVNAAATALEAAYKGLVKEPTPPQTQEDGNDKGGAVATGDSANIAGYMMMLLGAAGIAAVTFFRRKRMK